MRTRLSVVVAPSDPAYGFRGCVESLLAQPRPLDLELEIVVVASSGGDFGGAAWRGDFACDVVCVESDAGSLPRLMGAGIAVASGDWVALTEAHCTFSPGWLGAAAAAMRGKASAVGGAVEPGDLRTWCDWALYFCDYAVFMPPMAPGPTSDLPGNNILFPRWILEHLEAPAAHGFWKTFYCRRLERAGQTLLLDPSLVVCYHLRLSWLDLLVRRFVHGRCYGAMRAAQIAAWRRAIYALAAPILPFVLLGRLVRTVWPKGRYRDRFLAALPMAFCAVVVWVVGEGLGNLWGEGSCCDRV